MLRCGIAQRYFAPRQGSRTPPPKAQQLAVAAFDHLRTVAREAMRLVSKGRVMPVVPFDQQPTEQSRRDFKVRGLLFPAVKASQHMAQTPPLGWAQPGIGTGFAADRVNISLD